MEYFPSKLKERLELFKRKKLRDDVGMEEILEQLSRLDYNKYCYNPYLVCHGDYLDDKCIDEYTHNPRLRNIVDWVMRRIVYPPITSQTIDVRVRIAVCMLDKITIITASDNLRHIIIDNIVKNVDCTYRQKTYDLPF